MPFGLTLIGFEKADTFVLQLGQALEGQIQARVVPNLTH